MYFNPYFTVLYTCAKIGIKMQAISSYFISDACFSVHFIAVPTNTENFKLFSYTRLCTFSS